jgi:hypothetical protein
MKKIERTKGKLMENHMKGSGKVMEEDIPKTYQSHTKVASKTPKRQNNIIKGLIKHMDKLRKEINRERYWCHMADIKTILFSG